MTVAWQRIRESDALVLASLLWFVVQFLRYVLPPLFETFQRQYGVSRAELGLAFSGLMVAYAAVQFPGGWLADRSGKVEVIAGGALVFSAAALAVAASVTWLGLLAGIVLIGLGTGVHKTVAIPLLSELYPDSTGRTLGLMDTVGQFGGVVGPAAVVATGWVPLDWRAIFVGSALVGVGLAGSFFLRGRRRLAARGRTAEASSGASAQATDGDGDHSYLALFRRPQFVAFVAVTVLFSFAWNGLSAFLPLYLTDAVGLPSTTAGLLFSVLFVVSFVQPATGELSDRVGHPTVMTGALALATAGMAGLLVGGGLFAAGASVVGVGLGMHGFRPVRDAYLTDLVPDDAAAGTLGIVRTVMIVLGSAAPFLVGLVGDVGTLRVAFTGLAAVVAAATALLAVVSRL